jgi:hypothetical protein
MRLSGFQIGRVLKNLKVKTLKKLIRLKKKLNSQKICLQLKEEQFR